MPLPDQAKVKLPIKSKVGGDVFKVTGPKPPESRTERTKGPTDTQFKGPMAGGGGRGTGSPGAVGSLGGVASRSWGETRRDDDTAIITERAINSIPIFPEYDRRLTFPAGSTEIPSTSGLLTVNLVDGDGIFSIPFTKVESWTDIKVRFHCQGFADGASTSLAVRARLTDQAGKVTELPTFVRFFFSEALVYHTIYGERRVDNIIPGQYTLTYRWEVDANSFFFDERCTMHGSVIECTPIP